MTTSKNGDRAWETGASFVLREFDCDHSRITEVLGIQPTKTWRRGERIGSSNEHVNQMVGPWSQRSAVKLHPSSM